MLELWKVRSLCSKLPPGCKLAAKQTCAAGKLDTLSTESRVFEGKSGLAHHRICSHAINPSTGFRLNGKIDQVPVSFLLDTGSTVTLLREDTWSRINAKGSQKLTQCTSLELVGVDGSPLTVHGST